MILPPNRAPSKKRHVSVLPFLATLALLAALGFASMFVLVPLLGDLSGNAEEYPDAESVFDGTFGMSPPKDVTNLQAYGRSYKDAMCYLRFNAPPTRIQSLAGSTFTEISPASFFRGPSSISGPKTPWWVPPNTATSKFYHSTSFHPSYAMGQAYFAYDSATQLAYFYWDGWD